MNRIRLAWLENELLIIDSLRTKFEESSDLELVVVAQTLNDFREGLQSCGPLDLAMIDIGLDEPETGLDAIGPIREHHPTACIAILSNYITPNSAFIGKALDEGVTGFFAKGDGRDDILTAVRRLGAGEPLVATTSAQGTIAHFLNKHVPDSDAWHWFSDDERDLLTGMARSTAATRQVFLKTYGISLTGFENHKREISNILQAHGHLDRGADLRWEQLRHWAREHRFDLQSPGR